jgi:hypothetical protein
MRSGQAVYHPTLWRTCRALMNERRLACLSVVLANPGLSVGEIARMAEISENQASINLRALQAGDYLRPDATGDGSGMMPRRTRWSNMRPQFCKPSASNGEDAAIRDK